MKWWHFEKLCGTMQKLFSIIILYGDVGPCCAPLCSINNACFIWDQSFGFVSRIYLIGMEMPTDCNHIIVLAIVSSRRNCYLPYWPQLQLLVLWPCHNWPPFLQLFISTLCIHSASSSTASTHAILHSSTTYPPVQQGLPQLIILNMESSHRVRYSVVQCSCAAATRPWFPGRTHHPSMSHVHHKAGSKRGKSVVNVSLTWQFVCKVCMRVPLVRNLKAPV